MARGDGRPRGSCLVAPYGGTEIKIVAAHADIRTVSIDDRRGPTMHVQLSRPLSIWAVATAAFMALDLALNVVTGLWRQSYEQAAWPDYLAAQRALDVAVFARAPGYRPTDPPAPMGTFDLGAALQQTLAHGVVAGCLLGVVVLLAAYGQRVLAIVGVLAATASVGLMAGPLGTVVVAIPAPLPAEAINQSGNPDRLQVLVQRALEALPATLAPTWWAWSLAAVVGLVGLAAVLAVEHGPAGVPARSGGRITAYAVPVVLLLAAALRLSTEIDPGHDSGDLAHQLMWWITAVIAGLSVAAGSVARWRAVLALTIGWGWAFWLLLLSYGNDGSTPRGWGHDSSWTDFPVYASAAGAALVVAAPLLGLTAARLRDAAVRARDHASAQPTAT
jgi:hypothetical protein